MAHLRSYWLAYAWALVILILCLIPGKDLPQWSWADMLSLDKPAHAVLFGLLALCIYLGFLRQHGKKASRSKGVALALVVSTVYGVATEIMQGTLLTDRVADPLDQLANMVGIGATWFVIVREIGAKYWMPKHIPD